MARFLTGDELNLEIQHLIEDSKEQIVLISPYIKLHGRLNAALKQKMKDPDIKVTIVFGKNENDKTKSMRIEDFNFFKEFANIEIRYEKRLHAKYYSNESAGILTSMNLYDFSQNNNIEAGILMEGSLFGQVAMFIDEETIDKQTAKYFNLVIEQSELLFLKEPQFEDRFLGITKKYIKSVIKTDNLSAFFEDKAVVKKSNKKGDSFFKHGYCIKSGEPIAFNVHQPLSIHAMESWLKKGDQNEPCDYCHFSGESSNGKTNFKKPILLKNWKKAQETFRITI